MGLCGQIRTILVRRRERENGKRHNEDWAGWSTYSNSGRVKSQTRALGQVGSGSMVHKFA